MSFYQPFSALPIAFVNIIPQNFKLINILVSVFIMYIKFLLAVFFKKWYT